MRVAPKVGEGVGARGVVWAAVGQGECVPMHCRRNIGLWSPVGKVAVPFLVAGSKMLHLGERAACYKESLSAWTQLVFMSHSMLPVSTFLRIKVASLISHEQS